MEDEDDDDDDKLATPFDAEDSDDDDDDGDDDDEVIRPIDVEEIPEQEATWRREIAAITVKLQEKRKSLQDGEILRGVHPKSHGCVDAEFIVNDDLPEDCRFGLFAEPGETFEAKIRYSNADVLIKPDLDKEKSDENASRGMAIKVFDVGDRVLLKDGDERNQDFLMINTPEFAFGNVRDYRRLSLALMADASGASPDLFFLPLKLLEMGIMGPTGKLKPSTENEPPAISRMRTIFKASGVFDGFSPEDVRGTLQSFTIVKKLQSQPVRNPVQVQYFSAAPFRLGPDRVMKFSVSPLAGALLQQPFSDDEIRTLDDNYLAGALKNTLQSGRQLRLSFNIQVADMAQLTNRKSEMIENAAVGWDEDEFPFIEVAQIVIDPSKQNNPLVDACKPLLFTPWHALAAHEPLGGINRLRKPVYSKSAEHRR